MVAARVDLDPAATADHHYPAIGRQDREVVVQIDVGQHLEDHIDTPAAGQLLYRVQITRLVVVKDMVRPMGQSQGPARLRADRADHP